MVPMPMPSQGEQLPDKNPPPPRVEAANHKESKAVSGNIIRVKEVSNSCDSIPVESQYGSTDSIVSSTKSNGSDCRNSSAKSNDSGIGRGECSSDFIITEKSSPVLQEIASVPDGAKDLGLAVNGKQMKTPAPVGHRKRSRGRLPPVDPRGRPKIQPDSQADKEMTEDDALQAILQKHVQFAEVLIEELPATSSIVKRPVSRGGVAFDIKADGEQSVAPRRHNKPACVLKYAQQQRAAELVTHAELDEKQKAADQRRKVMECLQKIAMHA